MVRSLWLPVCLVAVITAQAMSEHGKREQGGRSCAEGGGGQREQQDDTTGLFQKKLIAKLKAKAASTVAVTAEDGIGLRIHSWHVADDAGTAKLHFTHLGRDYHYELLGKTIFSDDAVWQYAAENGTVLTREIDRRPNIFVSRQGGRRAMAMLHEGQKLKGLFQLEDGHILEIKPPEEDEPPRLHRAEVLKPFRPSSSEARGGEGAGREEFQVDTWGVVPGDMQNFETGAAEGAAVGAGTSWKGERWYGQGRCYRDDAKPHQLRVGIIVDDKLKRRYPTPQQLQAYITEVVSKTSFIYDQQFNVDLVVADIDESFAHFAQARGKDTNLTDAIKSETLACGTSITSYIEFAKQYNRVFAGWRQPLVSSRHVLTDCYPAPGVIGIGHIGSMCYHKAVAISSYHKAESWLVFAHEAGHNLGAGHSFEHGRNTTGGIMDYGDGRYNGVYQFNPLRRDEICRTLERMKSAPGKCSMYSALEIRDVAPTPLPPMGPGMGYKGCFLDNPDRDFKHLKGKPASTMKCMELCSGFKFMAMQAGMECWCDNDFSTPPNVYVRRPDAECGGQCSQDPTNIGLRRCGSGWRNAVYQISSKPTPPHPRPTLPRPRPSPPATPPRPTPTPTPPPMPTPAPTPAPTTTGKGRR